MQFLKKKLSMVNNFFDNKINYELSKKSENRKMIFAIQWFTKLTHESNSMIINLLDVYVMSETPR